MQIISQRLVKIFQILLNKEEPVSVNEFATTLNVSRRTVFRELEHIDAFLEKYELRLETSVKEGLYLVGDAEKRKLFANEIDSVGSLSSLSKEDRRRTFALALLDNVDFQKLYYYASMLEVSEATLSLDLDKLEEEFEKFEVELLRKKGMGIAVHGLEKNIRKALVFYLSKMQAQTDILACKYQFLGESIRCDVHAILSSMSIQLDWITPDSFSILEYRLCVQVVRLQKQQYVQAQNDVPKNGVLWQLAKKIATEMQKKFDIELCDAEVERVVKGLVSARAKQKNPLSEEEEIAVFNHVRGLTFLLIERFDERLAPTLKNDEEFVRGLSIHLWSAIERIKNGYEIIDPLNGQIKQEYPDIYSRTAQAAKLLEEEFLKEVPESEIVCLSAHFGAAVMQMGRKLPKRKLHVGIVCIGGIGVSYMLNSQVKKRFSSEVITEISDYKSKEQWEKNDFIISTIPLEANGKPVVHVNPILTQKDYETIRTFIENVGSEIADDTTDFDTGLAVNIDNATVHLQEVAAVLKQFQKLVVRDVRTVDDVAKYAGLRFAGSTQAGEEIYKDLMAREEMSSQMIESLDLLLLHCITAGVSQPLVALLYFGGQCIENSAKETAKTCLVILMPNTASAEIKQAIGQISVALIEETAFLQAVQNGDEQAVFSKLQMILQNHLALYFSHLFK